jgi:hypothetical protein
VQREGFLEDALAAALEHPEVWPRLRRLAGWPELPEGPPASVTTQDRLPGGRTDIVLRWANGVSLVIELKAWDPLPTDGKLAHYASTGHRVTVIAPHPTVYPAPFLPMLTWARLRALVWPGAPLVWQQLCHLIEAIGVAVPRLEMPAIMGLVPAWTARDVLAGWARPALHAVQKQLIEGGWPCVLKGGTREERVDDAYNRFGFWTWPAPWKDGECLGVFCGIYLGNETLDVLVSGVPDLRLMVHVNPQHSTAAALRSDPALVAPAASWAGSSGGVTRQYDPENWCLLDARESLVTLAPAEDQALAFRAWMVARASELIGAGIVGRLAAVQR